MLLRAARRVHGDRQRLPRTGGVGGKRTLTAYLPAESPSGAVANHLGRLRQVRLAWNRGSWLGSRSAVLAAPDLITSQSAGRGSERNTDRLGHGLRFLNGLWPIRSRERPPPSPQTDDPITFSSLPLLQYTSSGPFTITSANVPFSGVRLSGGGLTRFRQPGRNEGESRVGIVTHDAHGKMTGSSRIELGVCPLE